MLQLMQNGVISMDPSQLQHAYYCDFARFDEHYAQSTFEQQSVLLLTIEAAMRRATTMKLAALHKPEGLDARMVILLTARAMGAV